MSSALFFFLRLILNASAFQHLSLTRHAASSSEVLQVSGIKKGRLLQSFHRRNSLSTNSFKYRTTISSSLESSRGVWVTKDELERLADRLSISKESLETESVHGNYYPVDMNALINTEETRHFRLHFKTDPTLEESVQVMNPLSATIADETVLGSNLIVAEQALQTTLRWCDAFVANLNLCPWAKHSLLSQNAIRIKLVHQSGGTSEFIRVLDDSIQELIDLTQEGGPVDSNLAITFVVAIPDCRIQRRGNGARANIEWLEEEWDWEFEQFHELALDLDDEVQEEVIIAPFHPKWVFYSPHEEDDNFVNPLNFEKMTPFPTISVVNIDSITKAGEESTNKIAVHNERLLQHMGFQQLRQIYDESVWNYGSKSSS